MGKDYTRHRRCLARVSLSDHVNAYVYGTLVDKYLKRGREYLVMDCRSVDEDGIEICRDRRTIIVRYTKRPE